MMEESSEVDDPESESFTVEELTAACLASGVSIAFQKVRIVDCGNFSTIDSGLSSSQQSIPTPGLDEACLYDGSSPIPSNPEDINEELQSQPSTNQPTHSTNVQTSLYEGSQSDANGSEPTTAENQMPRLISTVSSESESRLVDSGLKTITDPLPVTLADSGGMVEFCGEPVTKRRRLKADPSSWKVEVNKKKRMNGEVYEGFKTDQNQSKRGTAVKDARRMGPKCNSKNCARSKLRLCAEFSEASRKKIFEEFWKDMGWDQKRSLVISLVDKAEPKWIKKRNKSGPSRRTETFVYFLKLDGRRKQVCREMFMNTLGLKKTQLRLWITGEGHNRKRKAPRKSSSIDEKVKTAIRFIAELPKLPSHYCRQNTSRLYLEPNFKSKHDLYQFYKTKCDTNFVSIWKFKEILLSENVYLYQPKKDKCDVCCSKEAGNLSEEDWNEHIAKKNLARAQKEKDKDDAMQGKCHVLAMDLQGVLMAPLLTTSAHYYKTKLIVHNFTIYDFVTRRVVCYLWDETEGGADASVFASCLISFLENKYQGDTLPIVIFSDGCTSQNRNAALSNALLQFAVSSGKTVYQKYLEKGHTQMEVDSVHSAIERALNKQTIFLPTEYVQICEKARRNPEPYEVVYMDHTKFKDYTKLSTYASIRPGNKTGDPHVTDIRQLKYDPAGFVEYKLQHDTSEFTKLPRNPKVVDQNVNCPALYTNRRKITKRKYQDIQDLLHGIPENCHAYFNALPK